jgi:propionyl-CoA carboxylase beta chain
MDIFDKIEEMEDRRWRVKQGGGDDRIDAQHDVK